MRMRGLCSDCGAPTPNRDPADPVRKLCKRHGGVRMRGPAAAPVCSVGAIGPAQAWRAMRTACDCCDGAGCCTNVGRGPTRVWQAGTFLCGRCILGACPTCRDSDLLARFRVGGGVQP